MLVGDEKQRLTQLEDQLFNLQNHNAELIRVIAKVIRAVNRAKPIKLNLSNGLIGPFHIDVLLSGLKGNTMVTELNLSNCALEDNELVKMAEGLKNDTSITTLKLGKNKFTSMQAIINLLLNSPT